MGSSNTWPNIPLLSEDFWADVSSNVSNNSSSSPNESVGGGLRSGSLTMTGLAALLSSNSEGSSSRREPAKSSGAEPMLMHELETTICRGDTATNTGQLNPRFKTEFCRNFQERGECLFGAECQFAHRPEEMRLVGSNTNYKTQRCRKYWTAGCCPYGPRCNFLHGESPNVLRKASEAYKATEMYRALEARRILDSRRAEAAMFGDVDLVKKQQFSRTNGESTVQAPSVSNHQPRLGSLLEPRPNLESLQRVSHGSGRMAAVRGMGEDSLWVDTYTGRVVCR